MLDPSVRLRNAVISGNVTVVKRLLDRFPDLLLNLDPDNMGWSNLLYASFHGQYVVCAYLVPLISEIFLPEDSSSNMFDLCSFDGVSPLHLPMLRGYSQTLHYLLQNFPGRYWLDYCGGPLLRAPLHYAAAADFSGGISLLAEFGADLTKKDSNGDTCLHVCFQYGFMSCINALLNHVATKNRDNDVSSATITSLEMIKNKRGCSPLDYSISYEFLELYKTAKMEVCCQKFVDPVTTTTGTEIYTHMFQSQLSFSEKNRVLSSPIVLVSLHDALDPSQSSNGDPKAISPQLSLPAADNAKSRVSTQEIQPANLDHADPATSNPRYSPGLLHSDANPATHFLRVRSQSQSLPSTVHRNADGRIPIAERRPRALTSQTLRPPVLMIPNNARMPGGPPSPQTPISGSRTNSPLKAVAITPTLRGPPSQNFDDKERLPSPSTSSISASSSCATLHPGPPTRERRASLSATHQLSRKALALEEQWWLEIKASPTHIVSHQVEDFHENATPRVSPRFNNQLTPSKIGAPAPNQKAQHGKSAGMIPNKASSLQLASAQILRSRRSSSASSNAARVSFSSSRAAATSEVSPRKTLSSQSDMDKVANGQNNPPPPEASEFPPIATIVMSKIQSLDAFGSHRDESLEATAPLRSSHDDNLRKHSESVSHATPDFGKRSHVNTGINSVSFSRVR